METDFITDFITLVQYMMMMNCFCGMVDRQKGLPKLSLFSVNTHHCQILTITNLQHIAGFETVQNLSSGFFEESCAVNDWMITTAPGHAPTIYLYYIYHSIQ